MPGPTPAPIPETTEPFPPATTTATASSQDELDKNAASKSDQFHQGQLGLQLLRSMALPPDFVDNIRILTAQALMSGFMMFQPDIDARQKIIHLVQSLFASAQITLALYLTYTNINCDNDNKDTLCKTTHDLNLLYQGFVIFALAITKAVKFNNIRLEKKQTQETSALAAAQAQGSFSIAIPDATTLLSSTHADGVQRRTSALRDPLAASSRTLTAGPKPKKPTYSDKPALEKTDSQFQAQAATEVLKLTSADSSSTTTSAVATSVLFTQTLMSLVMIFQPEVDWRQKIVYLIQAGLTGSQIAIALYLYHVDMVCSTTTNAASICKTANNLNQIYQGVILFGLVAAKVIKYNETKNDRLNGAGSPASSSPVPPQSPHRPVAVTNTRFSFHQQPVTHSQDSIPEHEPPAPRENSTVIVIAPETL